MEDVSTRAEGKSEVGSNGSNMSPHLQLVDWMISTHTTPQRLAELVRVTPGTVYNWMDGSTTPHPKNAADVAALTGVWLVRQAVGGHDGAPWPAESEAPLACPAGSENHAQIDTGSGPLVLDETDVPQIPEAVTASLLQIEDQLRRLESQIMEGVTVLAAIDAARADLTAWVVRLRTGAPNECDEAAE